MMLQLVEYIGVRGLIKWGIRLILLVALIAVLCSKTLRTDLLVVVVVVAAVRLVWAGFQWWWRRRAEAVAGARMIDGKIVPDTLVSAALDVPTQSADANTVLRGLPDYAKALLKLTGPDFEYVPEPEPEPEPAIEKPAPVEQGPPWWARAITWWQGVTLPRWAVPAGSAAALVIGLLILIGQRPPDSMAALHEALQASEARIPDNNNSTPAPAAAVAEAAPAPARKIKPNAEALTRDATALLEKALDLDTPPDTAQDDTEMAMLWLRSAANMGNAEAQRTLGLMYLGQWPALHIERNDEEGRKWIAAAAAQGDAQSAKVLAELPSTTPQG